MDGLRQRWRQIWYSETPARFGFLLLELVPRHGWNVYYDGVFLAELSREGWLTAEELADGVHGARGWFDPSAERAAEWLESARRRRLVEARDHPAREWATTDRGDALSNRFKLSAVLPIVGVLLSAAGLAAGPLNADPGTVLAALAIGLALLSQPALIERVLLAPTARAAWSTERRRAAESRERESTEAGDGAGRG